MLREEDSLTEDEDSFYTAKGDISQEENVEIRNWQSESITSPSHKSLSRTHYDSMGSSDQDSLTSTEDESGTQIYSDGMKTADSDEFSLDSINFNFLSF